MSEPGGQTFTSADRGAAFSPGRLDQAVYRVKGFGPPKRCKRCRDALRAAKKGGKK